MHLDAYPSIPTTCCGSILSIRPGYCVILPKILQMDFREFTFHALECIKARSGWAVVPRLGSPHEDCQRLSAERGAAPGEGAPRRAMRLRPPLRHIQKAMMNAHTASRSKPTSLMIDGTKPS